MEPYDVVLLQSALDDLEGVVMYIAKDSIRSAVQIHGRIIAAAHRLSEFPMMGRAVPDEKISRRGFRMVGVGKYLLFYKVYEKRVVILRVIHGMRDYPHLLDET
jgi:toxin ParE1/3/4